MKVLTNLVVGALLRTPVLLRKLVFYFLILPYILVPIWIIAIIYYKQVNYVLGELYLNLLCKTSPPLDMSKMDAKRSMQTLGTEFFVSGLKVRTRGKRWQSPIVFLHGFPDSPWCWHHQVVHFSKLGHCCVAVTLPGYAPSSCAYYDRVHRVASFSTAALTGCIEQLIIDMQCREGVILVAHDWGGMLAWTLAARSPQLVKKLVVMDCPHPKLAISNVSLNQLMKSFYFFLFQMPYLPEAYIRANGFDFIRRLVQFDRSRNSSFTDRDIMIMQHYISQQGVLSNALNYYRNLFTITLREWSVYEHQIHVPTLALWGSDDAALRPDLNIGLQSVCPNSECIVIDGASHWIPQDQPKIVNNHMEAFLKNE